MELVIGASYSFFLLPKMLSSYLVGCLAAAGILLFFFESLSWRPSLYKYESIYSYWRLLIYLSG
jgi:hypothetical protein